MSNEINIKSSTIEKGLDLVKDFTAKLIGPTVEEVGLLFSDKIKYYRFKNQVNTLVKAKEYVQRKNMNIKSIPIKILVPLLENVSLEEDENMQEKWGCMIGNLADTDQNLQNQIFPYLLSQISNIEFKALLKYQDKVIEYLSYSKELIAMFEDNIYHKNDEYKRIRDIINEAKQGGFKFDDIEDYEYANLVRLGLLKQLPPKIIIEDLEIDDMQEGHIGYYQLEAEYDSFDYGYEITSLGMRFLKVCQEKESN
jgi:hypothetical protein